MSTLVQIQLFTIKERIEIMLRQFHKGHTRPKLVKLHTFPIKL